MKTALTREHKNFLEALRRSGVTNMYGAVPYLVEKFDLPQARAKDILTAWISTYDRNDYVTFADAINKDAENIRFFEPIIRASRER